METKLRRSIIATFAVTFALIVAMIVVWKLKFYDDVTSKQTVAQDALTKQKTDADKLAVNLLAEAVAKDRVDLATRQLDYFQARFRSLDFDLTNEFTRNRTWVGYMQEYYADYGLQMRRQLVQAAEDTNVVLTTTLKVDAPPQLPEAVVPQNSGFMKPISGGSITVDVVGAYADIVQFLRRINRSAILMSIGNIKLEGASPLTKATFTITPYLVAKGKSIVLQAPAAAAVTTTPGDPSANPEGVPPVSP
jgi:hypothetical protein